MNFSEAMRVESKWTKTENGADAKNTTDSALLDMFATIGSMRERSEDEIIQKFELAFQEDPLGAMRCLFYARDVRGGLGERRVFRVLLPYIAKEHKTELDKNLRLVPEYGRYDDLYSLINTKLEERMWDVIATQLLKDKVNMQKGNPVSLLAKWLKKADSKNPNTKKLGILTAKKLGMSVYDYKRLCVKLRRHIDVVEQRMSANEWDTINYPAVPSRAMMCYREAFSRHDQKRFDEYLDRVQSGEQKINSSTLYPYDIVEKILYGYEDSKVLEAQWGNLPDYVDGDVNAVVMADVSGSMSWNGGRPLATSIGLAIYFAERNKGAYHNLFMTFSGDPQFVRLKGETITQKIRFALKAKWGCNTDLEAALMKILDVAIKNHCSQEEMPKSLIIISDMEIDDVDGQNHRENFYDYVSRVYEANGYKIPNVVFWNVDSRHDVFLADKNCKGVQLVSGQSASTFKNLIGCVDKTPVEMVYSVLNSERYQAIQV